MPDKKQEHIRIPVTQPFLPPKAEYEEYLDTIWNRNWLTNNGPLVQELESKLGKYLGLDNIACVSNGTVALQIAIKSLELSGEVITTPFSYVATTSSLVWEGCTPVFVDIDPDTWNLDPEQIEAAITVRTTAILATHVFGIPCDTETIRDIAERHDLKVIYDAAHAFGSKYRERSLFGYGDVSIASFHATKLFHTVEGGAFFTDNPDLLERVRYMRNFGHDGPWKFNGVGINGKLSEFHSAMGLVNLNYADQILDRREKLCTLYDRKLDDANLARPGIPSGCSYNYSYYPVLFESEQRVLAVQKRLSDRGIQTRRYFYPLLSDLEYVEHSAPEILPVAVDVSRRILCLPLYHSLTEEEIEEICTIVKKQVVKS